MNKVRFGVALPYSSARTIMHLTQLAEQAGWDGCFLGDAIWCEDPMISLAAAATVTEKIRLGTMIIPVPLRRPWKIASESIALDHLSNGRLILGLGTGATWMGWQAFPDEVTDAKARAEMLDETIDILTQLYQRQQFHYAGKHYHLKLTTLDEQHYPPKPVQQPRIPLWAVGWWPREKSILRALKGDGVIVEKVNPPGKNADLTPEDIHELKSFIMANRPKQHTSFDIVVSGKTSGLTPDEQRNKLQAWGDAGVTWWIEAMWESSADQVAERIQQGPPII
jgi:alkanesulfonate monooxygenase SsuD/methylene tetrahydromethanopterin reductase-like flavin-dependent oxidoreductase (luciferase family)